MKTTTILKLAVVLLLLGSVIGGGLFLADEIDCVRTRDGVEFVEEKRRVACLTNGVSDAAEEKLDEITDEHLRLSGTDNRETPETTASR